MPKLVLADLPPPGPQAVLTIDKVDKTFGSRGGWFSKPRIVKAVSQASFTVRQGETLGIIGNPARENPLWGGRLCACWSPMAAASCFMTAT